MCRTTRSKGTNAVSIVWTITRRETSRTFSLVRTIALSKFGTTRYLSCGHPVSCFYPIFVLYIGLTSVCASYSVFIPSLDQINCSLAGRAYAQCMRCPVSPEIAPHCIGIGRWDSAYLAEHHIPPRNDVELRNGACLGTRRISRVQQASHWV